MNPVSKVILNIPNEPRTSLEELEDKLSRLKGVLHVTVNPVMEKVTVDFNPSKSTVAKIRAVVVASRAESKDVRPTRHNHSRSRH